MIHHRGNEGDRLRVLGHCLGALEALHERENALVPLPFQKRTIIQACLSTCLLFPRILTRFVWVPQWKGRESLVFWSGWLPHPTPFLYITRAEQYVMNYLHLRHVPLLCVLFVYSYCSIQFLPPALDALLCVLLKSIRKKVALDWLSLFWGRVRVGCLWSHIRLCLRQNKLLLLGLPKILWANLLFIPSFKS